VLDVLFPLTLVDTTKKGPQTCRKTTTSGCWFRATTQKGKNELLGEGEESDPFSKKRSRNIPIKRVKIEKQAVQRGQIPFLRQPEKTKNKKGAQRKASGKDLFALKIKGFA